VLRLGAFWSRLDYQFINHPAYNRDRGPVSIFTLQWHVQLLTCRHP